MCDDNINIQNCCRICLDVKSEHVSILGDLSIHLHLKSCLGITVSSHDELPKTVCVNCATQLNDFYNFQLGARCSQDWLESAVEEKSKKNYENKNIIQPLPDSEYNSDSLLEFLNNTANIEEYLNNLGKEDIPSIVNMLDKNTENSIDSTVSKTLKSVKQPSPKKKETVKQKCEINMEIDVLDSDIDIVKEILMKEVEPRKENQAKLDKLICFGCGIKFCNIQKLTQHLSICDTASRMCIHCNILFDSKFKMLQHCRVHNSHLTCNCGKQFDSEEELSRHHKLCHNDYAAIIGCVFKCKQCGKVFKDRFQLHKHVKAHIAKANEKMCDICGHRFIGNQALAKHWQEVHGKVNALFYRCKICQHTSANQKQMYLHVKQHTMPQETEKQLCETCGRSFATRTTLAKHSLQHEAKKLECTICEKTFSDKFSFDKHAIEHRQCAICEKCGHSIDSFKFEYHSCVK